MGQPNVINARRSENISFCLIPEIRHVSVKGCRQWKQKANDWWRPRMWRTHHCCTADRSGTDSSQTNNLKRHREIKPNHPLEAFMTKQPINTRHSNFKGMKRLKKSLLQPKSIKPPTVFHFLEDVLLCAAPCLFSHRGTRRARTLADLISITPSSDK